MAEDETALPAIPDLFRVRDRMVMLDGELARHFDVPTKRLNEAVARHSERFRDFAFRLTKAETQILRSQNPTSRAWGGPRYAPHDFTENGVVLAATMLRSDRAVAASCRIVEAFVAMKRCQAAPQQSGFLLRLRERMEALMQAGSMPPAARRCRPRRRNSLPKGWPTSARG